MNFLIILKDKVNINLLYLFAISLSLGQKLSTYILIIWILSSLIFITPSKIQFNKKIVLLPLLYLLYIISLFYTEAFSFKYFEQKASLLAFPLLFHLNGFRYNTKVLNKALYFFVNGCLLSVLLCFFYAFYNSINITDSSITFTPQVNPNLEFVESSIKGGNFFYGTHFSIFHHTTYYAMFLCFAISILLFKPQLFINKKIRFILVFILSIVVLQVSSRAGLATLLIVFIFYTYNQFNRRLFIFISSITLIIILPLILLFNPRVNNLVQNIILKGATFHNEDTDSAALRLMTWDASLQIIKKNPILGVGIGDVYNELKEEYRQKRYVTPFRESFNAHNQYFQLVLECGILALILFFIHLFTLFKNYKQDKFEHQIILLFIIIITFNALFESILNHYSGIAFYSFLFCLFTIYHKNHLKTNT